MKYIVTIIFESGASLNIECDKIIIKEDEYGSFRSAKMYDVNETDITPVFIKWPKVDAIIKKERLGNF